MSQHTANIVQMGDYMPTSYLRRLALLPTRSAGLVQMLALGKPLPILCAGNLPRSQNVHTLWMRGHVHLTTAVKGRIPVTIPHLTCRRHLDRVPPQCYPCIHGS